MRNQHTTFSEYLQACHEYLHKPLGIETDQSLTSAGGLTSPKNKFYPKFPKPWEDFSRTQDDLFQMMRTLYHPPEQPVPRLFNPVVSIEHLGRDYCHFRHASIS